MNDVEQKPPADIVDVTYPFATWPAERLTDRITELASLQSVEHGELRKREIARELNHLIFETTWRFQNGGN